MKPEYTEVIKLLIRHDQHGSTPVAVDEKGDEYELAVYLDGDTIHPGSYQHAYLEAHKITED